MARVDILEPVSSIPNTQRKQENQPHAKMRYPTVVSASLALAGIAAAAPLQARRDQSAAAIIAAISPNSVNCAEATECRTNVQAAPFLIRAMADYGLDSPGQIGAVIALSAFESVDFKYKHNLSNNPGQGTSNMQMANFNKEFALSIDALKEQATAIGDISNPDNANKILALVTADEYNFASGAWYLTTKCPEVADSLRAATDAAFTDYMEKCVGVTMTPERAAYWARAKAAFGLTPA
ncbi:hypothetical protein SAMD00023353_0101710 [Rosellinia necatrix]|uniref:Uncharacterized protein n=1 Tax=Rosellinia necatrix TaxID=77044 RepID=A0A1S7UK04_ROSNE|nr:hypothetical protein SAMD00023353_0101710 [Rosellinia necatrix]